MISKIKSINEKKGEYTLPQNVNIRYDDKFKDAFDFSEYLMKAVHGIDATRSNTDADITLQFDSLSADEYILDIDKSGITIYASTNRGAIYGISTLIDLMADGLTLSAKIIRDYPDSQIRGVHFYMPERDRINEFKRIVDTMAYLKLNTVILEVGGAMEYEKHPEINEAWVKFCNNIMSIPGYNGYKNFQASDFYWKDSVHTEMANGSYLTKAEVKDIVRYCKSRGMDVIPEVQGLSHSYYLTVAHPEIAELKDDPFPDTYCPNDERSYRLYFDIAEEVIEVFEPTTVSIGHDEIRVLGWCDKCKGKTGEELVGKEINRLYEFYKEHGIRITMWGESVQTLTSYKGAEVGVKNIERYDRYGRYYQLPTTYKAIDMLQNDILMIDWQHSVGHDSEECYNKRGFEVIYGNFHGSLIGEWQRRTSKACYRGAEVSSWCPPTEEIFARDGIFFEMAYSSAILWDTCYGNDDFEELCIRISDASSTLRAINRGKTTPFAQGKVGKAIYTGNAEKAYSKIELSKVKISNKKIKQSLSALPDMLCGVSVDTGEILIKSETKADCLLFLHNCKKSVDFLPSHYFEQEAKWGLGTYAICYDDGTVELANIYYGREIGVDKFGYTRHRDKSTVNFELDNELEEGDVSTLPCYFTVDHHWTESLTYSTTPLISEDMTVFAYEWQNPHPEKTITKIRPYSVPARFNQFDLEQSIVLFGILAF